MILTVTCNPAYDVTYQLSSPLRPGSVHRVATVAERPGGKGVNVASVLNALGHGVIASGFASDEFADDVARLGIDERFVRSLPGVRRTLAVCDSGQTTSLWEPGVDPPDPEGACQELLARVDELLNDADVVVVSGSLPSTVRTSFPAELATVARRNGARVIVDISGEALALAADVSDVVLMPNSDELDELTGCGREASIDDVVAAGRSLLTRGASLVIATRGAAGMVLVSGRGESIHARLAQPVEGNPTGAGDAAAAAVAAGLAAGIPTDAMLRQAVGWSAAAVTSAVAGGVDPHLAAGLTDAAELQAAG